MTTPTDKELQAAFDLLGKTQSQSHDFDREIYSWAKAITARLLATSPEGQTLSEVDYALSCPICHSKAWLAEGSGQRCAQCQTIIKHKTLSRKGDASTTAEPSALPRMRDWSSASDTFTPPADLPLTDSNLDEFETWATHLTEEELLPLTRCFVLEVLTQARQCIAERKRAEGLEKESNSKSQIIDAKIQFIEDYRKLLTAAQREVGELREELLASKNLHAFDVARIVKERDEITEQKDSLKSCMESLATMSRGEDIRGIALRELQELERVEELTRLRSIPSVAPAEKPTPEAGKVVWRQTCKQLPGADEYPVWQTFIFKGGDEPNYPTLQHYERQLEKENPNSHWTRAFIPTPPKQRPTEGAKQ